jgi:hypothetical protein
LRTTVKEEALPKSVDTFTIGFSDLTTTLLEISWENSYAAIKFEVPTQRCYCEYRKY